MSTFVEPGPARVWESSIATRLVLGLTGLALLAAFYPGLVEMVKTWSDVEEYSYGYFIPLIVGFLIWQRSDRLRELEPKGSWWGVACIGLAALLCVAGRLSLVRVLLQYGFVLGLVGISLATIGRAGTRILLIPLGMLLLMVPLPSFLMASISEQLQLISSWLGVSLIQMCDISVYREGNVIDLGSVKLQVAEACSGLRYLFPLLALGLIAAYFFRAPLWKRIVLFVSALPLTVLVNSARIGLIGVTVEYWGPSMAEGLIHQFEGWFMFMICLALLFLEMVLLSRIGPSRAPFRSVFAIDFPERHHVRTLIHRPSPTRPMQAALALALIVAIGSTLMPGRTGAGPDRESFDVFPSSLPFGWSGVRSRLDRDSLKTLQLDDYMLSDFSEGEGPPLNFYVAYYASQTGSDKASHSPKTCIPGGGWTITDAKETKVVLGTGVEQNVNRVIIERGDSRDLVYYWFKQRGRWVTNEWAVKWYIFLDSIRMGRSDGALVRLVAAVPRGVPIETIDERLQGFMRIAVPELAHFVPD